VVFGPQPPGEIGPNKPPAIRKKKGGKRGRRGGKERKGGHFSLSSIFLTGGKGGGK